MDANINKDLNVSIILFNARSVLRKWPRISREIDVYNSSIVAVTETWLNEGIQNYYTYHEYQQFHRCRPNRGGGGVALYFRNTYVVSEVSLPVELPNSCDVLAVYDKHSSCCWVLIYRPPDVTAEDTRQIYRSLIALLTIYPNITILGDFNFSEITWSPSDDYTCTLPATDDGLSREFLEDVWAAWDLVQLVPKPSRGDSFLDLIFTTHVDNLQVEMFPPVLTSDHSLIIYR